MTPQALALTTRQRQCEEGRAHRAGGESGNALLVRRTEVEAG
jgi:hypothetical protein